jgi:hypothetical protein
MQVCRLDLVEGLGNVKTATIVMEALWKQALYWALLLQDEDPGAAADWKFLQPLLIERFDKAVNETHKFKLIAALQQRQTKSSKDFLNRCKTAWYGLFRKLRTKNTTDAEKAAHDDTRNNCIKCMFICGMPNHIRMAVKSIAGNINLLETALAAAIQYESGAQKLGGAQRYGQVAALEITGSSAASAPSSAPGAAGMQEMKHELAAISSALAALGVQKKGGKQKPSGGAPPRGGRKPAPACTAGGAGAGRSISDALGPVYARDCIKCYLCRQWGQHIAAECTRTQQEIDNLTPGAKLPPLGPAKDTLFNPN